MTPIHHLLHRIRHDPDFANGEFTLGCFDRVEDQILPVPLREIRFPPGARMLRFVDEAGRPHQVPLHRVREVYRDGRLIWSRAGARNPRSL